jgi:hypothetical protein
LNLNTELNIRYNIIYEISAPIHVIKEKEKDSINSYVDIIAKYLVQNIGNKCSVLLFLFCLICLLLYLSTGVIFLIIDKDKCFRNNKHCIVIWKYCLVILILSILNILSPQIITNNNMSIIYLIIRGIISLIIGIIGVIIISNLNPSLLF